MTIAAVVTDAGHQPGSTCLILITSCLFLFVVDVFIFGYLMHDVRMLSS